MYTLYEGDCLEYMKSMPDKSVDAVITDPPYPKKFLPLWEGCAAASKQVLKSGGWFCAYSGQLFMPQVLASLSKHLTYRWCIALLHGQSQIVWPAHTLAQWKPIFILQNGKIDEKGTPIRRDVMKPRGADKDFHEWGQNTGESVELVDQFTNAGDTIFDPFMGSGTTGVACMQLGRNFIGCEIDPTYYTIAEKRIKQASLQQPLLFAGNRSDTDNLPYQLNLFLTIEE